MRHVTILLLLMSMDFSLIEAQPSQKMQQIKIGEKVPEIKVHNIQNYSKKAASLLEFYKDKPLIIAFSNTHCNTALKCLPKLNALRNKYNNGFNVLSVTDENDIAVKKLFGSLDTFKNIHLPYVTDDTTISVYFKYRYMPHIVWINTKGVVCAITSEDEITSESVNTFIRNDTVQLLTKNDDMEFDEEKPYTPPDSLIEYRSLLTRYNPSIRASLYVKGIRDSLSRLRDSVTRICMVNVRIVSLFYEAFAHFINEDNFVLPLWSKIVLEVKDSNEYYFPNPNKEPVDVNWKMRHLYCYELTTKPMSKHAFFENMLNDLNKVLPVKGSVEKRKVACYAIVTDGKNDNLVKTKGGAGAYDELRNTDKQETLFHLKNVPLSYFIETINLFSLNRPVIDETGIKANIDLDIHLGVKDREWFIHYDTNSLERELEKYGLTLEERMKEMDVLVILDK